MSSKTNSALDYGALQKKYAEERSKRMRSDGTEQWQEIAGKFAHFAKDPWSTPDPREAIEEDVYVLIIGAGFGGLQAAAQLRMHGVDDIRILDKSGNFGGTWYWNRYPGVACDIESYIYLPLLEETGYIPTEKYVKGAEIREHCHRIAKHFDLEKAALFNTQVQHLAWDEQSRRWQVTTDRGDKIAAQFVVSATGLFDKPKLPGIPGIEAFEGHTFHSARWDYDYTGGDSSGNMTALADKSVGIIGTGATGVQATVKLAASAGQLFVFQRTPTSIDVRDNRPTDPEWAQSLKPGWQRDRRLNFTKVCGGHPDEDLVNDRWSNIMRTVAPPANGIKFDPVDIQQAEMLAMESTRRRVDEIVHDSNTAEALKTYFHYFCKRPGFSDEYLQVFNQDNVVLVDTNGKGVERVTATGVVVNGEEFPVDCLIFATGYEFMPSYGKETGIQVIGRNGEVLDEQWKDGRRTLYGMHAHGFPNLLWMSYIQSGPDHNFTHALSTQAEQLAYIISECKKRGISAVEPSQEAVDAWVDEIKSGFPHSKAFAERCTPGYATAEGDSGQRLLNTTYPGGILKFIELLEKWRENGKLEGLLTE
jgi:cyclohexanone monooxygenase